MIVRELLTRLGFSVDKRPIKEFERGIEGVKHSLEGLRGVLEVVGVGLSLYGGFEFFKSAAEASEHILKTSQKIGVGVESLQRLKYAAELADIGLEGLTGGLKFLSKNLVEAQDGSKEATKAFADVLGKGFNPKQVKNTEELFLKVADRFKGMQDGAKKTALAIKIFGRSGIEMIPLLNQGADAIRKQGDELEAFGGVLGVDALKAGEEFNDNLKRMQTFFLSLRNTIAARFFPALVHLQESFIDYLKVNKEVIKVKLDHYLQAIANGAKFLTSIVAVMWKGFENLVDVLGSVEAALISVTLAWFSFGVITGTINLIALAFLALGAAIFLVWEDYNTFLEGGDSLLDWPKNIKAVTKEFEAMASVLSKIQGFFDEFVSKPLDAFIQKGVENGLKKSGNFVQARSREELQDAKSTDIGGFIPDVSSPFIEQQSGYETTPLIGQDGSDVFNPPMFDPYAGLPPLLDMPAPENSGLTNVEGDTTHNNDVQISQTIQVNVNSGADPDQIAEQVRSITREENEKSWLEAGRALEPGAVN